MFPELKGGSYERNSLSVCVRVKGQKNIFSKNAQNLIKQGLGGVFRLKVGCWRMIESLRVRGQRNISLKPLKNKSVLFPGVETGGVIRINMSKIHNVLFRSSPLYVIEE